MNNFSLFPDDEPAFKSGSLEERKELWLKIGRKIDETLDNDRKINGNSLQCMANALEKTCTALTGLGIVVEDSPYIRTRKKLEALNVVPIGGRRVS